ncbi:hypothetical protein Tco_0413285 [Tanacetum coccineum]
MIKGDGSDMEDMKRSNIPEGVNHYVVLRVSESEKNCYLEPEWTITPNDFTEPNITGQCNTALTLKSSGEKTSLQRKTYDIGSSSKWFCQDAMNEEACKVLRRSKLSTLAKAFSKESVFLHNQYVNKLRTTRSGNIQQHSSSTGLDYLSDRIRLQTILPMQTRLSSHCRQTCAIRKPGASGNVWETCKSGLKVSNKGSGQRMTRAEAKGLHLRYREKTTDRWIFECLGTGCVGRKRTHILRPNVLNTLRNTEAHLRGSVRENVPKGIPTMRLPKLGVIKVDKVRLYSDVPAKNRRDSTQGHSIVSGDGLRYDMKKGVNSENIGKVPTEMELDIIKMEMEMEIPSVKASANSDVKYSFTSAQDGEPLQDDVRLCLGNDLKKAQDHSQRHV